MESASNVKQVEGRDITEDDGSDSEDEGDDIAADHCAETTDDLAVEFDVDEDVDLTSVTLLNLVADKLHDVPELRSRPSSSTQTTETSPRRTGVSESPAPCVVLNVLQSTF